MGFYLYVVCDNTEKGEELVVCLNSGVCMNKKSVNFKNKYFKGSAPVVFVGFEEDIEFKLPFAVVFIYKPNCISFIANKSSQLQEAECKILLCEQQPTEELENFCENEEIELVTDSIQQFSGFIKTNSEFKGIGRIKEALECAAASFVQDLEEIVIDSNEPQPTISENIKKEEEKTHKKELTEEELEHELQDFDYFLTKIKENVTKAQSLDDQTRKQNAENTILALAKYLSLDESDEDS